MPEIKEDEIKSLLNKYQEKLNVSFSASETSESVSGPVSSQEYETFKKEEMPLNRNIYEKLCAFSEKIVKLSPGPKREPLLKEAIDIAHLNVTPTGAESFAFFIPLATGMIMSVISFLIFVLLTREISFFFPLFFIFSGLLFIPICREIPFFISNSWRMRASNQMVLSVFYVVTYMRHTSNLENAIAFASDHLSPPLSLDFKKVLWDVETQKFQTIKESLDNYLETWRKWNIEFIESFHLIESSLYEGSEDRRLTLLDKSLTVILDGTYEKMLHYAQNLKSPVTMLHMFGVILPILGLVILPLVVAFMTEIEWYHIAMVYNVALPIGVYIIGKNILSSRPTGYGDTDITKSNSDIKEMENIIFKFGKSKIKISPAVFSIGFLIIFFLIGISPIIMYTFDCNTDYGVTSDFEFIVLKNEDADSCNGTILAGDEIGYVPFYLINYKIVDETTTTPKGPFGFGASLLSIFVIVGIGGAFGYYYKLKTEKVIKIRNDTKNLENEFASALFQLGNRLGDGLPAEIAFERVAVSMGNSMSGEFFSLVSQNIMRRGMSVDQAIFDPEYGALAYYPSNLIESSMKVLSQASRKGPKVAAQALINISTYVKEIHTVNERLKDLLADIISSMKSQISFLTPAIAGIVIGITSMIMTIIGLIGSKVLEAGNEAAADAQMSNMLGTVSMFKENIPTYYFQIIIGIYVIEITYILTIMSNGIENGADTLNERHMVGKNVVNSTLLYVTIALIVMALFNVLASFILQEAL